MWNPLPPPRRAPCTTTSHVVSAPSRPDGAAGSTAWPAEAGAGTQPRLDPQVVRGPRGSVHRRPARPEPWWLTRTGARLVEGTSPAPGKGDPNPLFLRHTAAIAGLYVAFREVGPDAGLTLTSWRRDEESWEDWDHHGRAGRIRPGAYAEVQLDVDGEPGTADAFVEVDFATMDQARLRAKVARHRRYAAETIWWDRHPCCPALLLVTTCAPRYA